MTSEIFRVVHLVGVFLILSSLAALWGVAVESKGAIDRRRRVPLALLHGAGMAIVLISGLTMAQGWPLWMIAKGGIWLALGGSMMIAKRRAKMGIILPIGWVAFAALAALLALTRPF